MNVSTNSDGKYSLSEGTNTEILAAIEGVPPENIIALSYDAGNSQYAVLYIANPSTVTG